MTAMTAERYPLLAALAAGRPLSETEVNFTLRTASCRRQQISFNLLPGVVNDDAAELFGYSKCHLLAFALHEKTGWPIAMVEYYNVDTNERKWLHLGVETPDGLFLDIQGGREFGEVIVDVEANFKAYGSIITVYASERSFAKNVGRDMSREWKENVSPLFAEAVRCFAARLVEDASR